MPSLGTTSLRLQLPFFLSVMFLTFSVCQADVLPIYVSPNTPRALQTDLKRWAATSTFELDFREVADVVSIESSVRPAELVIDALYNKLLSYSLQTIVGDGSRVISGNDYGIRGVQRLFVAESEEMQAAIAVVKAMKISRICAIFQESALMDVSAFEGLEMSSFTISHDATLDALTLLIKKQIKPKGFTLFLLWLPPATLVAFFTAMQASHMDENPLRIVISYEASSFIYMTDNVPSFALTGPIFLVDEPCEEAVGPVEYLDCKLLGSISGVSDRNTSFAVMNIVGRVPTQVGRISQNSVIISLSNSTHCETREASYQSTISISFNNGTTNPAGEANTSEKGDYLGALLAKSDVNQDSSLLNYHQLEINNVTFGLYDFQYNWTLAQIGSTPRSRLGVALIPGEYSVMTIGIYKIFSSLGYKLMMVGAGNTSPVLSSPRDFPLYSRVMMSDIYLSVLYSKIVHYYGWKHIAVVYCDDLWSRGLYSLFLNETQKLGITIVNNDTLRVVPSGMGSDYHQYLSVFQGVVDSRARIVILILFGEALYYSIEALYDLGLRKGDIVFLATEWLNPTLFAIKDAERLSKIRELCDGAIEVYPTTYIGHIGEALSRKYEAESGMKGSVYACFYYDAVYLLAHAIDYLLMVGGDYEKPERLASAVRKTRFRGCSGVVTIEETSNDRSPIMYDIFNSRVYPNGSYEIIKVGTYDPGGLLLFNFTSNVIWPGNTTTVPSDLRLSDFDCPFAENQVESYTPSLLLSISISVVLCLAMTGTTIVVWRNYWRKRARKLNQRVEISFEDYLLFLSIWVEALLYVLIGPYFRSWGKVLTLIGHLIGVNVSMVVHLRGDRYWESLYIALGTVGVWTLLLAAIKFERWIKCEWVYSCLATMAEKTLPFIGNLAFIPIVSLLLDIYQCPSAVKTGSQTSITSTFLQQDCYTSCWTFPHLFIALLCLVTLLAYVPCAVYLRPSWQNLAPSLHIDTSPSFIMLKTIYQVAIILAEKTLKHTHSLVHSASFAVLTVLFAAWSAKMRPFGYSRASLWQFVSLICVVWFAVLSAVCELVSIECENLCLYSFFIGVGVAFLTAAVFQTKVCPSLLYRRKGVPVVELFRFMFNRGRKYMSLFKKPAAGITLSDNEVTEIRRVPLSYSVSANSEAL